MGTPAAKRRIVSSVSAGGTGLSSDSLITSPASAMPR
jgi:hypothetical protein